MQLASKLMKGTSEKFFGIRRHLKGQPIKKDVVLRLQMLVAYTITKSKKQNMITRYKNLLGNVADFTIALAEIHNVP